MAQKIDICEKTLFTELLKKFIKIILFAGIYIITTMIIQKLFYYDNPLGVALIIFGIFGFIYTMSVLLHEKLWSLFYNKIDIKITHYCIGKTRSMNYGEIIYFPYIEYLYNYRSSEHKSANSYWDFESCYDTQWTQMDGNSEYVAIAREKVELLTKLKEAYVSKLLPSIGYLDIHLSKKRKKYFLLMNILSLAILVIGMYLL